MSRATLELHNLMSKLIEQANAVGVPMTIAFETDSELKSLSNKFSETSNALITVQNLVDSNCHVEKFLLQMCKVNNVKSEKNSFASTIIQSKQTRH